MNAMTVFAASPDEVDLAYTDAKDRDGARPTVMTNARTAEYAVLFRSEAGYLVKVVYDPNNHEDRMPQHVVADGME